VEREIDFSIFVPSQNRRSAQILTIQFPVLLTKPTANFKNDFSGRNGFLRPAEIYDPCNSQFSFLRGANPMRNWSFVNKK
jgi:hypothetical protein